VKVSYNQLSEMTGMAYRTLKKRLENLAPAERGPRGVILFESRDALPVIYGNKAACDRLNHEEERARLASAQATAQEMKNAQLRKELLPANHVRRLVVDMITNAKTRILGVGAKIAPMAAELSDPVVIQKEVDILVKEVLATLAKYAVGGHEA
jgi:phage terminase Nu1 subunit (DNA packaging protein)